MGHNRSHRAVMADLMKDDPELQAAYLAEDRERWWNLTIEIIVPFDTKEQARAALENLDWDRFYDVTELMFPDVGIVMTGHVDEAVSED